MNAIEQPRWAVWPEHRVAELKRLAATALSCSEIAAQMGLSRNAVIGKLDRIRLNRARWRPFNPERRRKEKLAIIAVTKLVETPPSLIEPKHLPFDKLKPNSCRYPYGFGPYTFCGHERTQGPYCEGHAAVAYQKPR